MTIKKATLRDIIENATNAELISIKAKETEEMGQPVININCELKITETIGKTEVSGISKVNLIYLVDSHMLLTEDWELIA